MSDNTGQGPLTEAVFYILLALHKPLHGYGIMQFVSEISRERVVLGPGTLYGALNTLVEKGWIKAVKSQDSRKKEYEITRFGRNVVQTELDRLSELVDNGKKIVEGVEGEDQTV